METNFNQHSQHLSPEMGKLTEEISKKEEQKEVQAAKPESSSMIDFPMDIHYSCGKYNPDQKKYMIELMNDAKIVYNLTGSYININGTNIPLNIFPERARCPVLISVVGVGLSGKNTFTQLVKRMINKIPNFHLVEDMDIVGPVKKAARVLLDASYEEAVPVSDYLNITNPLVKNPSTIQETKPDSYRQLLADIKRVWQDYYGSPVMNVLYHIINLVKMSKEGFSTVKSTHKDYTTIVFLQNRDQYTIDMLNEWCPKIGIIHFVLKVDSRRSSSSDFGNSCDSTVDEIPYDILIKNDGDVDHDLAQIAESFAQIFSVANCIYGIDLGVGDDPQVRALVTKVRDAYSVKV